MDNGIVPSGKMFCVIISIQKCPIIHKQLSVTGHSRFAVQHARAFKVKSEPVRPDD